MKKLFKLIVLIAITSIVFNSCRKGEDDPFLSLQSRTKRLSGSWKLSGVDFILKENSSSNHSTSHMIYNNGVIIITDSDDNSADIDSIKYTQYLNIDKNGTFNQRYYSDTDTSDIEGNWTWLGKNKELGLKNKEAFILTVTKKINGTDTEVYTGKYIIPENIYVLKKLSSEEIVITIDYSKTNKNGHVSSEQGTMTYTKQ